MDSPQCGGLCGKPVVIRLLLALAANEESCASKEWRRERTYQLTLSEFVGRQLA